jgi:hypothetical protein
MRPGIEKVLPFDPAGFIDQDPQRLSGAAEQHSFCKIEQAA